jgi:DNA polymerase-1
MAETDRVTSSKPNLQNQVSEGADEKYSYIIGQKIKGRRIFKAREGHWILSADLMLAEVAVAAWTSDDELLQDQVRRATLPPSDPGYVDLHADLAVRSFKLNCPPTKAGLKAAGKGHLRTAAKRTRFGHYYGAQAETLLRKIREEPDAQDVTLEDVQGLIAGHDETYPALARVLSGIMQRAHCPGWACGPYGAYRRSRVTRDTDRAIAAGVEREFRNFLNQNPVADAVHMWLAAIWRERARRGLTFRIVLSVHDSVMLEVPYHEAEEVVDEVVVGTITKQVPFVPCDFDGRPIPGRGPYYFGADVSVGPRWEEWLEEDDWRAQARAAQAQAQMQKAAATDLAAAVG